MLSELFDALDVPKSDRAIRVYGDDGIVGFNKPGGLGISIGMFKEKMAELAKTRFGMTLSAKKTRLTRGKDLRVGYEQPR